MRLSGRKVLITRVVALGLTITTGSASMLAIVVDKEIAETRASFLAFETVDT